MNIVSPPFQPPFIRKTSSTKIRKTKAEGRFWRDLINAAERRMRGCPVIFNRLIIWMFWLKCKDEGKRRYDRPNEGMILLPPHENHAGIFENLKMCTYASGYTYGGISLHVYTHRATRTYAWAYTYICHCVRLRHILSRDWISLSSLLTKAFLCCIFVVRQI